MLCVGLLRWRGTRGRCPAASRLRRNGEQPGCRGRLLLRTNRSRCCKPPFACAGRLLIARLVAARRGLLAGGRFDLEAVGEGSLILSQGSVPGEQAVRLGPQELRPAGTDPARGGAEAGATQQR